MNLSPISFFHRIQSWFSHAEATATEETLEDIPPKILIKLEKIIRQLPDPPTYSETIQLSAKDNHCNSQFRTIFLALYWGLGWYYLVITINSIYYPKIKQELK